MRRFFRATPSFERGLFSPRHERHLPGVACERCRNKWAMTGVSAPRADVARLGFLPEGPSNVPWSEYDALRARTREALDNVDDSRLLPGAGFGAVIEGGRRRKELAPSVHDVVIGILVDRNVKEALGRLGVHTGPPARLRGPKDEGELFEIDTPLLDTQPLGRRLPVDPCARCGYPGTGAGAGWSGTMWADVAAVAPSVFRVKEFTTAILVDEEAKRALEGLAFSPVEVVDDV